jgi:hypothetical protein
MVLLNEEESCQSVRHETTVVDDPLCPSQQSHNTFNVDDDINATIPIVEEGNEDENNDFTTNHNHSCFRSFFRYARAIFVLLLEFVFNLTTFDSTSIVSKIVKLFITVSSYTIVYTSVTARLLWAVHYLMEHNWYILVVTCSVVLLFGSVIVLACYEWMWRWQDRTLSWLGADSIGGYDAIIGIDNNNDNGDTSSNRRQRLRPVTILDDDDMEDDLSLRAWTKRIGYGLICCLIWSLYCVIIVTFDFFITDQYIIGRPSYYKIELRLLNCFEAAPIMFGAALCKLYYTYPYIYRWHYCEQISRTTTMVDDL